MSRTFSLFTKKPKNINELLEILQYATSKNVIDTETLHMLEGVINIQELNVKDAMLPKTEMVFIRNNMPLEEIISFIAKSGHSRIPVAGDNADEIIGILLAKDLLQYVEPNNKTRFVLKDILRPATFIPANKRLDALLQEFQKNRNHMAIVVDEYGGTTGLITIEDVIEQIVGNIEDEHDVPDSPIIRKHGNNIYSVKAKTTIDEFNDFFNTNLEDEGVETIGGLVIKNFGYLPNRGEYIQIDKFTFKVLHSDNRKINLLQVIKI